MVNWTLFDFALEKVRCEGYGKTVPVASGVVYGPDEEVVAEYCAALLVNRRKARWVGLDIGLPINGPDCSDSDLDEVSLALSLCEGDVSASVVTDLEELRASPGFRRYCGVT